MRFATIMFASVVSLASGLYFQTKHAAALLKQSHKTYISRDCKNGMILAQVALYTGVYAMQRKDTVYVATLDSIDLTQRAEFYVFCATKNSGPVVYANAHIDSLGIVRLPVVFHQSGNTPLGRLPNYVP